MYLPEKDPSYVTKTAMFENIVSLLGGRVAEQLVLDDISTGASSDLLLPEVFEQRIKLIGKKFFLAYPSDVIYFADVRNATVRFEDNRHWAKQNFHVQTHPDARWNNAVQRIPAGTVLEWTFEIALYVPPENGAE